ncbi:BON domain-containing protein [Bdellovibrio sp. NC01]|uniref:BON domain-containing protein n=1 Tax=Bdellovibrio sp. NC01 TaxID=2220073 RepID=UPI00115B2776|nr:BON domain-containing protein [Bdellovibrio sp. NC01]QDK37249.1 BON domain-containing protein [Bdellovibrio sp. NC01]
MNHSKLNFAFISASLILAGSLAGAVDTRPTQPVKQPDNTAINQRDATTNTLTPTDQARGSTSDVELTRRIRSQLTADSTLSTNAQNVKIITLNGHVTLRGPVDNAKEKQKIEQVAKSVSGTKNVDNQIEVIKK